MPDKNRKGRLVIVDLRNGSRPAPGPCLGDDDILEITLDAGEFDPDESLIEMDPPGCAKVIKVGKTSCRFSITEKSNRRYTKGGEGLGLVEYFGSISINVLSSENHLPRTARVFFEKLI